MSVEKKDNNDEHNSLSSSSYSNNTIQKNGYKHKLCLWSSSPWRQHSKWEKKTSHPKPLGATTQLKKKSLKMFFVDL
jgi:hypothetical protein